MLVQTYAQASTVCRRIVVPACDPPAINKGTNPTLINALPLILRKGDIIDVGFDWSGWIAGNGGGQLLTSTWVANAASPKPPVFSGAVNLFDVDTGATVALLDVSGAAAADTFWLDNTVTIKGAVNGGFTMPNRTLTRSLWVVASL
jgi:hypothetical protein